MIFKYFVLTVGGLILAGCAAQRLDIPETHPANPAAVEAPVPAASTTLKIDSLHLAPPDNAPPDPGHAHHPQGTAANAPYQCPMHPEVRSDKPGRCPKCGMQLKKGDG